MLLPIAAQHPQDIAAAALFVSSKLEEWPIRIRDLINCFDYLVKLVEWERSQLVLAKARSVAASLGQGQGAAAAPSEAGQAFRYQPMDYFAKEFYDFKDDIVIAESQILKVSLRANSAVTVSRLCATASGIQRDRTESLWKHRQLSASA